MAGDTSFEEFYGAQHRRLVGQLSLLTGSRQVAEDVVQEAFIRAYARWARIERWDQPDAWVRKVAVNLARSRWRRLRVHDRAMQRMGPGESVQPDPDGRADLAAALATLPANQRAAIVLHHVAGSPVAEIAELLGAREGTVKSWLSRGRSTLARSLGEGDDTGDAVETREANSHG